MISFEEAFKDDFGKKVSNNNNILKDLENLLEYEIPINQQFLYISNTMGDCVLCPYGCKTCMDYDFPNYVEEHEYSNNYNFSSKFMKLFNNSFIQCIECREGYYLDKINLKCF